MNTEKWILKSKLFAIKFVKLILKSEFWRVNFKQWISKREIQKANYEKWISKSKFQKWVLKSDLQKVNFQKWISKSEFWKVNFEKWIFKSELSHYSFILRHLILSDANTLWADTCHFAKKGLIRVKNGSSRVKFVAFLLPLQKWYSFFGSYRVSQKNSS